jgi:D-tyrosyl-tRNA(Tyr) deacylase
MAIKNAVKIEDKKILKMGDYHYVSIPKALLDTNVLSTKKKYDVTLIEIIEKAQEQGKGKEQKKAASSN